ncbi:MAG: carboxypeptidase-like regulatory domain-containing protein [Bacteroidales bacterium]|nr:carboxypeptidase-like regulatory domain-containing protein [Bacteroidales bacterium]
MKKYVLLFLIVLTGFLSSVSAQTKVRGLVIDSQTGEPLPFVNIVFKGTTTGTITDVEGKFFIQAHIERIRLCFLWWVTLRISKF